MSASADQPDITREDLLRLTTDVVASYLANNSTSSDEISDLIRNVHTALASLGREEPAAQPVEKQKPAVPISKSIQTDFIVCLEDGKRLKMLKRYLRSKFDMTPDDYRRKWGLPSDYPMVAPAYANRRSEFAKQIGLGRGGRTEKV